MKNNDKFVRKFDNIRKFETSQKFVNNHKFHNVGKLTNNSSTLNVKTQAKPKFSPKQPNFPNPSISKPTKVSYTKGKFDVCTINSWLEGQGKQYQNGKFSEQQIKTAFDKFVNKSTTGSSSSHDSQVPVQKWKPVMKVANVVKDEMKVNGNPKLLNNYISISRSDDVDIMDSVTDKVKTWFLNSKNLFKTTNEGPNKFWVPKFFQ